MHVGKHWIGSNGRSSMFVLASWLALASVLAPGCDTFEQPKSPLLPYAEATLTAGVGLGDLQLGRTTLVSVVQRLGVEKVTPLAGEQVALELFYENGQLALLFVIEPGCMEKLKTGLRGAEADINGFLARNPCVREATLSSLSVRSGTSLGDSFFQGATDAGAKLWDPLEAASRHGQPGNGPQALVAGLNLSNPDDELHFRRGITFYYRPLEDAGPRRTCIERITIYPRE